MIPRFRAWIKPEKQMIEEDDLLDIDYDTEQIMTQQVYFVDGLPDDRDLKYHDFEDVELMQSTGLFDKNGKEIFEGDIIDTTDYEGGLSSVGNPFVKVESDKYGFIVTGDFPGSPITLKEFEDGRKFAGVKVKIIGNVYQNSELLEVDHDRD